MANEDRPRGFELKDNPMRMREYTAGTEIFPGDAVHMEADGKIDQATLSENLLGVAADYASADGQKIQVYDDPDQVFIVQANGNEVGQVNALNLNYDIVPTAGDSTYLISRQELDSSTAAPSATLPLKLIGIDNRVDNAFGSNVDCVVIINNHSLKGGTGTAGV